MLKYIKNALIFRSQKEAEKEFEKIKTSIKALSRHQEFRYLVEYWEREYTKIDDAIDKAKEDECFLLIKERAILKKYLLWLEQMTKSEDKLL